ncbi:RNA ligase [Rhodococcoides fascians]|uniref:RNA ligase n=1 Tax=Rhodococcoides fascians TaxID=1828 RepID=UPI00068CF3D4|nr:RNA ligase [Rhodococcus fascians]
MVNIDDLMNPTVLQDRIDAGLVKVRSHPRLPYRIYNYSELTAYSQAWDEVTLQCRGLIVDDSGEVIARPFPKFFNDAEHDGERHPQLDLDAPVRVSDKLDGSLGILYPTRDGLYEIATRGSFESEQARWATDYWQANYADDYTPAPGFTYLVEIIYKANRIVVDYDFEDLVLLGVVDNTSGEVLAPFGWGWPGRKSRTFPYDTLADALRAPVRDNAEGFVVQYRDGTMVKLKLERYVQLHKIVTGMSEKTVWEHAASGQPFEDLIADLPDEFHDWLTTTWNALQQKRKTIGARAVATYGEILDQMVTSGDRKGFAAHAVKHDNRSLLFCLADGQHDRMNDAIWKQLKPRGDSFMLDHSEAVA